jgi:HPt (histidine-containing phosphotransfer) domain-containing protein
MEALAKMSHGLKSVSGLIPIPETGALAAKIQVDCLNGQHEGLEETVEKLQQDATTESKGYAKSPALCQRPDA